MNRNELLKIILNEKPNISDTSSKIYTNTLMNLAKNVGITTIKQFHTKTKEIIDFIQASTPIKGKAVISALLATGVPKAAEKKYKNIMLDLSKTVREEDEKQEKSAKQEKNWESWSEIMKTYKELEEDAMPLFKKDSWNPSQMKILQNYVILSCYVLIPPRRIADYINFKVKDIDHKEDNFFDFENQKLVFNSYKTAKSYGTQVIDCPNDLKDVLFKWFPICKKFSEYLFFNSYGNQLSQPQMTKIINQIFDKNISASMLRHIYISDVVLKDVPKLSKLEKVAEDMGHGTGMQMLYKKF